MSISVTGGIVVNTSNRTVTVDGKVIAFHPKMNGNNISTINNKSYVDGYALVDGKWKKTLKALWYKWF